VSMIYTRTGVYIPSSKAPNRKLNLDFGQSPYRCSIKVFSPQRFICFRISIVAANFRERD